MKKDFGNPYAPDDVHIKGFRHCVKAQERKLKWLSDAEFINWDKAVLACPQPGSFPEDRDFAVLNVAMWNERRRRRDRHNGTLGWRRFLTPADRDIWLEYYEKAVEADSKRPRKGSAVGPQVSR
jgi:hypothetical protein